MISRTIAVERTVQGLLLFVLGVALFVAFVFGGLLAACPALLDAVLMTLLFALISIMAWWAWLGFVAIVAIVVIAVDPLRTPRRCRVLLVAAAPLLLASGLVGAGLMIANGSPPARCTLGEWK